ncbi:MAG: hypothetical protein AAF501_19840 [Pseudomonadota bacterium]
MPDEGDFTPEENEERIVLISCNESYWMLEGEDHIQAMLTDLKPFPKPVRCISFENQLDLALFLPKGTALNELWGINPLIVARLREKNQLIEISPPL